MRVFAVQGDGTFKEFVRTRFEFDHQEADLEDWLENNPEGIVEDGKLMMIGRQVWTNLGGFIDLLAVDRQGDVAVIELKRNRTPRDILAQALEYTSFVETLDWETLEELLRQYLSDEGVDLADYHRQYFQLGPDEAVSFNKDQRIVMVGQTISDEIRQTSTFLRKKGFRVTCVEFGFFESETGGQLLSSDIVVGKEPVREKQVSSGSRRTVSKEEFLQSLDQFGRPVFEAILALAADEALPIHWGSKGLSLNVDVAGTHVAVCFGYPPDAVYGQTVYTVARGPGSALQKLGVSEDFARTTLSNAEETGLFEPAGRELKCMIDREFSRQEISSLLGWIKGEIERIREAGPHEE